MPDLTPISLPSQETIFYEKDMEKFTIKRPDSFEIYAHGVNGISLKIHAPSIDRMELKMKLMQLHDAIMRCL